MDGPRKHRMFKTLVEMGFHEIKVGFLLLQTLISILLEKSLNRISFLRTLLYKFLTQAREELIQRTCESLLGSKNCIVHLYKPTSTLQRRVVFESDRNGVKEIAVDGAKMVRDRISMLENFGSQVRLEYSPEKALPAQNLTTL